MKKIGFIGVGIMGKSMVQESCEKLDLKCSIYTRTRKPKQKM